MNHRIADLEFGSNYQPYIDLVRYENPQKELLDSIQLLEELLTQITPSSLSYAYAEGKWTIAQVVGHCIECEIIFANRVLTIARSPTLVRLSGFDVNEYAKEMSLESMKSTDLLKYAVSARNVSIGLSNTLSQNQMSKIGLINDSSVQVEALLYIMSGHMRHHLTIIQERYLG